MRFRAAVTPAVDGLFDVTLTGEGMPPPAEAMSGIRIHVRPMTMGNASDTIPRIDRDGLGAKFRTSFEGLTAFFRISLGSGSGEAAAGKEFLIAAELIGVPEDRMERLLVSEIRTPTDLIKLLLLLLGQEDSTWSDLVDIVAGGPRIWGRTSILGSEALLEPLLRSLTGDPERLDEIDRLMREISRTPEGQALVPDGWPEVWEAVSACRPPAQTVAK